MAFNDIFTVLKNSPLPEQKEMENIPSFMLCRYLGGHQVTIFPANEFNKYYKEIPVDIQYKMIKKIFAGKNIYPVMLKKSEESTDTSINNICKHYKVSQEKAQEYLNYISSEELAFINTAYEIKG